jgi:hypothetical protein
MYVINISLRMQSVMLAIPSNFIFIYRDIHTRIDEIKMIDFNQYIPYNPQELFFFICV